MRKDCRCYLALLTLGPCSLRTVAAFVEADACSLSQIRLARLLTSRWYCFQALFYTEMLVNIGTRCQIVRKSNWLSEALQVQLLPQVTATLPAEDFKRSCFPLCIWNTLQRLPITLPLKSSCNILLFLSNTCVVSLAVVGCSPLKQQAGFSDCINTIAVVSEKGWLLCRSLCSGLSQLAEQKPLD